MSKEKLDMSDFLSELIQRNSSAASQEQLDTLPKDDDNKILSPIEEKDEKIKSARENEETRRDTVLRKLPISPVRMESIEDGDPTKMAEVIRRIAENEKIVNAKTRYTQRRAMHTMQTIDYEVESTE